MRQPRRGTLASSFGYAWEGVCYVVREERNARIHVAATIAVVAVGLLLGLSTMEWALIVIAISLVFVGEMLNTVVEVAIDLVSPHENVLAKCAKDVAAGAILLSSIAAAIIGLLVLGPRLWSYISSGPVGNALGLPDLLRIG